MPPKPSGIPCVKSYGFYTFYITIQKYIIRICFNSDASEVWEWNVHKVMLWSMATFFVWVNVGANCLYPSNDMH